MQTQRFDDGMDRDGLVVVAGGGGFIGGHLVADLKRRGFERVRAVDIKPVDAWHQRVAGVDSVVADLREPKACGLAVRGASVVYNLAADMGGMGFIETHKADCMVSVLINTHLLQACRELKDLRRYFYASSACVYRADLQATARLDGLREADAYPAMPEDGYGWEKLFSERMCRHFREDYGVPTRVARFHNVYGPYGTWRGGREKAPAAICRKVAEAVASGEHSIEVWGDGKQTRSFMYIDDCLEGMARLMGSEVIEPINLGSDEGVSINGLVSLVESIAGVELERRYKLDAPKGVNGRNSDNTRIRELLGWAPGVRLRDGLEQTYAWVSGEYAEHTATRKQRVAQLARMRRGIGGSGERISETGVAA
ncbi:MAG: NAD-dependent epimerase/dehydratase family protein [Planctomycetota bacterium]